MDTGNNITGLTNTNIMDMKMAETFRRKKHRRGKKNRTGRKSPGNIDVFSTFDFDKNIYMKHGHRNRKFIRPTHPKAPMNSTQFLIEDRGHDNIDIYNGYSPPFQGLSPDTEDFTSVTFYNPSCERKRTQSQEDFEYMPIDFDDTVEFIEQEFEKDLLNSHQYNHTETAIENCANRRELSKLPKFTIIQKMFELEAELKSLEDERRKHVQNDLAMKIEELREQNSTLKSENLFLRNLLS